MLQERENAKATHSEKHERVWMGPRVQLGSVWGVYTAVVQGLARKRHQGWGACRELRVMLKHIWTSRGVETTSEWHGCAGSTSDPAALALEESKPTALAGEDAIWVSLVLHSRGK